MMMGHYGYDIVAISGYIVDDYRYQRPQAVVLLALLCLPYWLSRPQATVVEGSYIGAVSQNGNTVVAHYSKT